MCVAAVGAEELEKQRSSPWTFILFGWDTVGLQLELGSARETFYSSILLKDKLLSIAREMLGFVCTNPIAPQWQSASGWGCGGASLR